MGSFIFSVELKKNRFGSCDDVFMLLKHQRKQNPQRTAEKKKYSPLLPLLYMFCSFDSPIQLYSVGIETGLKSPGNN